MLPMDGLSLILWMSVEFNIGWVEFNIGWVEFNIGWVEYWMGGV